jgi:hypothetical protein
MEGYRVNRHKLCIVIAIVLALGFVSSTIGFVFVIWEARWNTTFMKKKDNQIAELSHENGKFKAEAQFYEREVKRFQGDQELLYQVLGFASDTRAASVAIALEKEARNVNDKLAKPFTYDRLNVRDLLKKCSEDMSNR